MITILAWRRWGNLDNPNWIQSLLLFPEDIKSFRHGFWQLGMVAAEWAMRLSAHIQDRFDDASGGAWAAALADEETKVV